MSHLTSAPRNRRRGGRRSGRNNPRSTRRRVRARPIAPAPDYFVCRTSRTHAMTSTSAFVDACRHAIGADHVLTDSHDTAPFLTDWRRRYQGAACAVLRPANTEEVAALVKLALEHRVALVPQGGNTGLA
ncbi:FAD-binding oxidoreductase, partial [Burkholderia pseudomallei]